MIELNDFWPQILQSTLKNDGYWCEKLSDNHCRIHLALMTEPYLSRVLNGEKVIESRFSTRKILPYQQIKSGDIVVLKKSGGGLCAVFEADWVKCWQFENSGQIIKIKEEFGDGLCVDEVFWDRKKDAKYATLIKISHLQLISPISVNKPNRQSWLTYSR